MKTPPSKTRPQGWQRLLLAMALQVGVAVVWLGLLVQTSWAGQMPLLFWLVVHGLVAAGLSHWRTREPWWTVFHLAMPWLALLALQWQLPLWVYPLLALLLLAVFSPVLKDRVPFFLSSDQVAQGLLQIMDQRQTKSFVDLGCATGGLLVSLARSRPDTEFVGVETAWLPYWVARMRAMRLPNLTIRRQSIWDLDLKGFDLVYCFLSPDPMARLGAQFDEQADQGASLVSNSFQIPGRKPGQTLPVQDWRESVLWVYPKA
ncbi:MAG: class I SAM-dependent methyltransferase [Burkholderiaceae bacterium]